MPVEKNRRAQDYRIVVRFTFSCASVDCIRFHGYILSFYAPQMSRIQMCFKYSMICAD